MSVPGAQQEVTAAVTEESELQDRHTHGGINAHLAEVITPETARSGSRPVRIAFEGCGHGMLDDIYTAIQANSESRGWHDGVDLVIIGGDFQAVRNPADLLCLSVPQKYRRLGDFPAYYSGAKKAPYLTIFVGGNHEASNHMQELYYGGWVAPNIYYLGAANVIRFAGLRIAGLSGIFAPYDYGRHHFERLPYNMNDQKSVYHVRQIDVRKLMQLQSQVDIAISHDWPRGIEHYGNTAQLFYKKRGFREDSESGKLGNPAANDLLRKLRPRLWLSAHLHVRFEAVVNHTKYDPCEIFLPHSAIAAAREAAAAAAAAPTPSTATGTAVPATAQATNELTDREAWMQKVKEVAEKEKENEREEVAEPAAPAESEAPSEPVDEFAKAEADAAQEAKDQAVKAEKITAWNNFHSVVEEQDAARAAENDRNLEGADPDAEDEENNYQVTWRKVETGEDGMSRVDAGVEKFQIPQSKAAAPHSGIEKVQSKNSDEIDLYSSDADDNDQTDGVKLVTPKSAETKNGVDSGSTMKEAPAPSANATTINPDEIDLEIDEEMGGTEGDTARAEPVAAAGTKLPPAVATNSDEIDIDMDMEDDGHIPAPNPAVRPNAHLVESIQAASQPPAALPTGEPCANTSSLVRADGAVVTATLPAGITNTVTQFLSLDKIQPQRPGEFLDLLEVPLAESTASLSLSDNNESVATQPNFRLEYDPEWLSITKALASEITYGCEPDTPLPPDQGDVGYLPTITASRAWVEENIVAKGKLAIPHNFTQTAPPITDFNDPEQTRIPMGMAVKDQPREYTNPQTVAYCEMLEINNVFNISEEKREKRREKGPRPEVSYARKENKRNFNGPRGPGAGSGGNFRNDGGYRKTSGYGGGRGGGRGGGTRNQRRGHGSGRDWSWYNTGGQQQYRHNQSGPQPQQDQ